MEEDFMTFSSGQAAERLSVRIEAVHIQELAQDH